DSSRKLFTKKQLPLRRFSQDPATRQQSTPDQTIVLRQMQLLTLCLNEWPRRLGGIPWSETAV
ncbi:MAG: hypothetical protein ACKPJD_19960, partial [Planctomycetaceae bacterium]